jgi:phage/plasmid-associated DNA primase
VTGNFYNTLAQGIFISNPKLSQAQKSEHTSHLVPLIGVRLGICQEINKDSTLNGALIKSLSAGDPFKCRGAFEKLETEHVPFCKLVLCVNPKPKFDADDQAIVDRARYIPFNARFVDEPNPDKPNEKLADKQFAEETMTSQEEKDNFFSWLVGGAKEFYANNMKLKTPQLVIEAKKKSVAENDVVGEFLNECCLSLSKSAFSELSKDNQKEWITSGNDLNAKFSKWMEDNGESQPKRGVLSTRLEKLEYKKVKSNGNFVFQGLKFIPEEET